jgi:hypothetical protein
LPGFSAIIAAQRRDDHGRSVHRGVPGHRRVMTEPTLCLGARWATSDHGWIGAAHPRT